MNGSTSAISRPDDAERRPGRGFGWLVLVPVLIGLFFEASSAAHGDAGQYELFPTLLLHEGTPPLQPWESAHFSHYLTAAALMGLGELLGIALEASWVARLLDFLLHGALAASVASLVYRGFPKVTRTGATGIGLLLATIPAWAWCAQLGMSDVSGNAFALLMMSAFVHLELSAPHESRPGPLFVTKHVLLGLGLGWMLMWRISSAAFAPLFLWLFVRLLVASPTRTQRIVRAGLITLAAPLPPLLYLAWLLRHYGPEAAWGQLLRSAGDNARFKAGLSELLPAWWSDLVTSHGGLIWLGLGGLFVVSLVGLACGGRHPFRARAWLLPGFVIGLVPYLVAVARNQAWSELRYLVPVFFAVSLGCGVLVALASSRIGRVATWASAIVLALLQLSHAAPMLHLFKSREAHVAASVREQLSVAEPSDVLISHYHQGLQGRVAPSHWLLPMSHHEDANVPSGGYLPRNWAEGLMLVAHAEGRRLLIADEILMRSQIEWLEARGWQRTLLVRMNGSRLRNYEDCYHADMDVVQAGSVHDVRIWSWTPPNELGAPWRHAVAWANEGSSLEVVVEASDFAGWEFCVVYGTPVQHGNRAQDRQLWLPMAPDDPVLALCGAVLEDDTPSPPLRLRGRVGADGRGTLTIPGPAAALTIGLVSTVLFVRENESWKSARFRTAAVTTPARE